MGENLSMKAHREIKNRYEFLMKALAICTLLVFSSNSSSSQPQPASTAHWALLALPFPSSVPYLAQLRPYFLNENIGFIFRLNYTAANGVKSFFRTTDGGATWQDISFLKDEGITQVYFVTLAHGYLSSTTGIYETQDTGITWKNILQSKLVNKIYG